MRCYENDQVTRWAITEIQEKMARGRDMSKWHASELRGCLCKAVMRRRVPQTHNKETIMRFMTGFALQEWFLGKEAESKEAFGIFLSADKVVGNNIIEFKTTRKGYEVYQKDGTKYLKHLPKLRFDPSTKEEWILRTRDYCLSPETRILTADLRWTALKDVFEGDEIIAFDELPRNSHARAFRKGKITRKSYRKAPRYRIRLKDGRSVLATREHPWLARLPSRDGTTYRWYTTEQLSLSHEIKQIGSPWEQQTTFEAGWLAGMLDGEGWTSSVRGPRSGSAFIGVAQKEGPVLDRMEAIFEKENFAVRRSIDKKGVVRLVVGGIGEALRLLGEYRPARLLNKSERLYESRSFSGSALPQPIQVDAIEYEGIGDVVTLTTDTSTFIAEGLMTHNCAAENLNTAHILVVFLHADDLKAWTVEFTDDELDEAREQINDLRTILESYWDIETETSLNPSLPPCTCEDWMDDRCYPELEVASE